ncbi:MAG: META domain-containing protein [Methanoregulaceae archaeon]|nr:META domain-containing protein [Methanoregulaceae archaeon]
MRSLLFLACSVILVAVLACGCTTNTVPPTVTTATSTPTPLPVTTSASDQLLTGQWTFVAAIVDNSAPRITNNKVSLAFSADGTLSGNAGCNNYNAAYTLTGEHNEFGKTIVIGPLGTTKMNCQGKMEDEQTYLLALKRVTSYTVAGNKLTLTITPGNMLAYERAKPS